MIFGWDLFLEAGGCIQMRQAPWSKRFSMITKKYFEYVAESINLFMVPHDDIAMARGPVFRPDWYRKYIFPIYEEVYETGPTGEQADYLFVGRKSFDVYG